MKRLAAAALATLAACATTGEPVAPAPPPSFAEVKTLLLVRSSLGRAGRARDPLDGLDESLRAHGYQTRIVELGSKPPKEQVQLERLFVQLEARAGVPRGDRFGARTYSEAGRQAAETVVALGVDAVASYHRLDGRTSLATVPVQPPVAGTGSMYPTAPHALVGPMGALALVDRSGHMATFPWGEPDDGLADPGVPLNAAEAIDLLVRTLSGVPPDEDR